MVCARSPSPQYQTRPDKSPDSDRQQRNIARCRTSDVPPGGKPRFRSYRGVGSSSVIHTRGQNASPRQPLHTTQTGWVVGFQSARDEAWTSPTGSLRPHSTQSWQAPTRRALNQRLQAMIRPIPSPSSHHQIICDIFNPRTSRPVWGLSTQAPAFGISTYYSPSGTPRSDFNFLSLVSYPCLLSTRAAPLLTPWSWWNRQPSRSPFDVAAC